MSKELFKKLGNTIREAREKKKLSQESLAFKAGVSSDYIGKIERGLVNPSIDVVHQIAKALDLTLSQLLKDL